MAHQAEASESEFIEFLNVASTESGCPGEQWAMLALKTYNEIEDGITVNADVGCQDENVI